VFDDGMRTANADRLANLRERLAPWTTPQAVLNASGGGIDPAQAFDGATWARLRRVQDQFDPARLIVSNHATP
jgi:hypothetical protein